MKVRNGFVSNSSSSSFILLGTKVDGDELKKMLEIPKDEDLYDCDLSESTQYGFDIQCDYENDSYYIGKLLQYGDGFYGGDIYDPADFAKQVTDNYPETDKLKAMNKKVKLHIVEIPG